MRPVYVIGSLVLAGVMGVAACGSTTKSKATPPSSSPGVTTTAGTTAAATGSPVKVMVLGVLSGPTGFPDTTKGAQAAADSINAHGGFAGHVVQVDACDDTDNPDTAGACARRAASDGVVAVIDGNDGYGQVVDPLFQSEHIPYLVQVVAPQDASTPGVFPSNCGVYCLYTGLGAGLVKEGCSRVDAITIAGDEGSGKLVEAGVTAAGGSYTGTQSITPTQPDVSPQVSKALGTGAGCLALVTVPDQTQKVLGAVRQSSKPTTVVGGANGSFPNSVLAAENGAADGSILGAFFYTPGDPRTQPMLDDISKVGLSAATMSEPAQLAWIEMQILDHAAAGLSSVDAGSMMQALGHLSGLEIPGMAAPVDFTKSAGIATLPRLSSFATQILIYKASGPKADFVEAIDTSQAVQSFLSASH